MDQLESESYANGLKRAQNLCEIRAYRPKDPNELDCDWHMRREEARLLSAEIGKELDRFEE